MSNNLSELSLSYYEENDIYKIFSQAEDFIKLVDIYLLNNIKDKVVLDLGCGNGKYINILKPLTKRLYGIDLSQQQLNLVGNNEDLICADASKLPFKSESMDIIYSCWMFGTILEDEKRLLAMNEAKRVLKPDGKIILIENSNSGEFEIVRGRYPDPLERTKKYNDWLLSQKFIKKDELKSYFKFESDIQANKVFSSIWKDNLIGKVKNIIFHNISVFEFTKRIDF